MSIVKKNAGFSLIELIVVLSIMSILAAGVVSIVLSRSDWSCRKASDLISTALSETRADALAKTNAWMQIEYDSTEGYILKTSYAADVKLGTQCEIYYETSQGGGEKLLNADGSSVNPLTLSFARGSGEFLGIITAVNQQTAADGSPYVVYDYLQDSGKNVYCTKLVVRKGSGGHQYVITLYPETGKYSCERE